MKNPIAISLLVGMLFFSIGLTAEEKLREDVYKSGAPTFNDIEIPLLKRNKLSEWIGDDRFNVDLYLGQYAVYTTNSRLTRHDRKDALGWANVAGGIFKFEQPDVFDLTIAPHVIYVPMGTRLESVYTNLNVAGNWKINEMFKTGFASGFDFYDDEFENDKSSNIYASTYLDFTPTESMGLRVDGKYYRYDSNIEGINGKEFQDFNAYTVSAMPYWKFETGQLGLRYTHGDKFYDESGVGDVGWDEISIVGEKELSERWKVKGDVGFQNRRYQYDNDLNTVVGSLGVEYRPTEKWLLALTGARRPFDSSSYTNYEVSNSLVFDTASDAQFGVANDSTNIGSYGVANTVGLNATYSPIYNLKLGAGVSGGYINEYRDSDYWVMRTSLSAVYSINEYVSIGASYIFRADADDDHGYTDNLITLGVSFAF